MNLEFRQPVFHRSVLILILYILVCPASQAQPAQRLILHFSQPLNTQQLENLQSELKLAIPVNFEFRQTSNKQSGLIIFNYRLTIEQLTTVHKKLLNNPFIYNIETDQLLEKK